MEIEFVSLLVYREKRLKAKINSYIGKIDTEFYGKKNSLTKVLVTCVY